MQGHGIDEKQWNSVCISFLSEFVYFDVPHEQI